MKVVFVLACITATAIAAPWRILGGNTAGQGQFPYHAALLIDDEFYCGGSILDESTILCAAHCVEGEFLNTMTIAVGSNKLNNQTEIYKVASYVRHENYDWWEIVNDVAIIKLAEPIKFSVNVQPIKLRQTDIGSEEEVVLSGWGKTTFPGHTPNDLQFINLKTITFDSCVSKHERPVFETEVCTFTKAGEGACHGDSGGPLVDMNGEQIGIVSWGMPCGIGYPDVFTRVFSFLEWIEANRR